MVKRAVFILLLLVVALSPLCAQDWRVWVGGGEPGLLDAAIIASILVDLTGYGFCAVGGYDLTMDADTVLAFFAVGSLAMTGGGLAWNLCLDARGAEITARGRDASSSARSLSWTYTWVSLGCSAVSIGAGFLGANMTGFIVSFLGSLGAMVFETMNILGPRIEWSTDLWAASPSTSDSFVRPPVLPVIQTRWEPGRSSPDLALGIDVAL